MRNTMRKLSELLLEPEGEGKADFLRDFILLSASRPLLAQFCKSCPPACLPDYNKMHHRRLKLIKTV